MSDLELVDTKDLVMELARRTDALALAWTFRPTENDSHHHVILKGPPVTCVGLSVSLSINARRNMEGGARVDRSDEMNGDEADGE